MNSGWIEFEAFCVYPPATGDVFRVESVMLDLSTGTRTMLHNVPMLQETSTGTLRIVSEPPWDTAPQHEREFFESRLEAACTENRVDLSARNRPEFVPALPRVRYLVPDHESPGRDKEVPDPALTFVPPFESSWERQFDGDVAEPPAVQKVVAGISTDVVQTVTTLGTGLKVLDVGCAAGLTGEAVKQVDPTIEWVGIDNVPAAAEEARRRLDAVHMIDIEREHIPYAQGYFDVAVLSQVLEHMYNPWKVLKNTVAYLRDGGILLCSVPHLGHVAVLAQLLEGRFPYSSGGPLDIGHVRSFTCETLLQLVEGAGCQPAVLTKSMFRMTRYDERLMEGLIEAGNRAGLDCSEYSTDGWTVGFTVLARKQHVTVTRRSSLVRRADRAGENGDPVEARRILELETRLRPENALAHMRLAGLLRACGDIDEGIAVLQRCARLHTSYMPARYELIRALHEAGRTEEALSAFERAATVNTNFFMPLQKLFS